MQVIQNQWYHSLRISELHCIYFLTLPYFITVHLAMHFSINILLTAALTISKPFLHLFKDVSYHVVKYNIVAYSLMSILRSNILAHFIPIRILLSI